MRIWQYDGFCARLHIHEILLAQQFTPTHPRIATSCEKSRWKKQHEIQSMWLFSDVYVSVVLITTTSYHVHLSTVILTVMTTRVSVQRYQFSEESTKILFWGGFLGIVFFFMSFFINLNFSQLECFSWARRSWTVLLIESHEHTVLHKTNSQVRIFIK